MKIIMRPRNTGKTAELIRMSAESGHYIICADEVQASNIRALAKEMGLNIPYPLTFDELINHDYYVKGAGGLFVDDADKLIQFLGHGLIEAITMTYEGEKPCDC